MVAIYHAYYKFCRVHQTLRMTPVMEAGPHGSCLEFGGIGGIIGAEGGGGCGMIQRHKWSILSLVISVGMLVAIGSYTQYQYRVYHVTDFTHTVAPALGVGSVLASVATGIAAVIKEKASPLSLVAIVPGVFSMAFYTV